MPVWYIMVIPFCSKEGGAWGLNTLTSKYVFLWRPPQHPLAAMSSRAPSWLIEEAPESISPVRGCRGGSTLTSWQTLVSRLAVRSQISLCLSMGNPPFGQVKTWSMVKDFPQAQWKCSMEMWAGPSTAHAYWLMKSDDLFLGSLL